MIIMIDYNTYNLPGNYEEPGKLSHLWLEYREIDGEKELLSITKHTTLNPN